jgi:nucleotide-binding universal stress UspA family protein
MKLLIGYDGSESSNAALHDLRKAGLPAQVSATVLCVANVFLRPESKLALPPAPDIVIQAVERARARDSEAMEKARATARRGCKRLQSEFPGWEVRAEASCNSPAWGLIQKAEEWKADLIIVGSHGRTAFGRVILGSVAQRVVTNATCSVRVARGHEGEVHAPIRILVGYDGSPASVVVLEALAARVWPPRTIVELLTVIEPMSTALALASLKNHPVGKIPRTKNYVKIWLETMTESAAQELRAAGPAVSSAVVEGEPQTVLLRAARRSKADCIFLGARGIRAIQRFLLGSVSTAVTARAHCTVEVIRPLRKVSRTMSN